MKTLRKKVLEILGNMDIQIDDVNLNPTLLSLGMDSIEVIDLVDKLAETLDMVFPEGILKVEMTIDCVVQEISSLQGA